MAAILRGRCPMKLLPSILTLLALASATPRALAQEIKLLDLGGNLYSMDANSAEVHFIGSTGLNVHI